MVMPVTNTFRPCTGLSWFAGRRHRVGPASSARRPGSERRRVPPASRQGQVLVVTSSEGEKVKNGAGAGGVEAGEASWFQRGPKRSDKLVYLIRHGCTEMNEFLATTPYDSPGFKDPLLYDTRLSKLGREQARRLNRKCLALDPMPEVLLASPLTRALDTAESGFEGLDHIPREVAVLARERVWLSSDTGRPPAVLAGEFPDWTGFDGLDDIWWHNTSGDPKQVTLESKEDFQERMDALVAWLDSRPEKVLAVVCHWGVISALTGVSFNNCEVRPFKLAKLKPNAAIFSV